jgi:hypothetical protein
MIVIKPPHNLLATENKFSVFLAGSIEMGKAEDWQSKIEKALAGQKDICIFNPRREGWNASWKQDITNPQFSEQVNWELDALERANLIVFYFSPETKSPVSMLELGLFAKSTKVAVCCPNGFWRKGNVDIVCKRYGIKQVENLNQLAEFITNRYEKNSNQK